VNDNTTVTVNDDPIFDTDELTCSRHRGVWQSMRVQGAWQAGAGRSSDDGALARARMNGETRRSCGSRAGRPGSIRAFAEEPGPETAEPRACGVQEPTLRPAMLQALLDPDVNSRSPCQPWAFRSSRPATPTDTAPSRTTERSAQDRRSVWFGGAMAVLRRFQKPPAATIFGHAWRAPDFRSTQFRAIGNLSFALELLSFRSRFTCSTCRRRVLTHPQASIADHAVDACRSSRSRHVLVDIDAASSS